MTAVGEFHYLHHDRGGRPYADPNAMNAALAAAAAEAGIRLTLLDVCYLSGGLTAAGHLPLDSVQERFSDGSVDDWAERVAGWSAPAGVVVGAAVHSVRAVPEKDLARFAELLPALRGGGPGARPSQRAAGRERRRARVLRLHADRAAGRATGCWTSGPARSTPPT